MKAGRPPVLTPAAVRWVRAWHQRKRVNGRKSDIPEKRVCERYGMSRTAIWQAAVGRTYRWVT